MTQVFKAKIRRIGTSSGLLIPKEVLENESLKDGEEVEVSLTNKKRKLREIMELFGTARRGTPFVRDRQDRLERYK